MSENTYNFIYDENHPLKSLFERAKTCLFFLFDGAIIR